MIDDSAQHDKLNATNMNLSRVAVPTEMEEFTLEWFNNAFEPLGLHVIEFAWMGEAGSGSGYMSSRQKLRLTTIRCEDKTPDTLSVVVKTLPRFDANVGQSLVLMAQEFCSRELQFYNKAIPDLMDFLDSCGVSAENRVRFPKCYYGAEEGRNDDANPKGYKFVLLLEDMTGAGYKQLSSDWATESLYWPHVRAVVRQMALFHAQSTAFAVKHLVSGHSGFQAHFPFLKIHDNNDGDLLASYVTHGLISTITCLREYPAQDDVDKTERIIKYMEYLSPKTAEIVQRELKPKDTETGTIRHGDLHINNLLFNADAPEHFQACMLDFQVTFHGRPMGDLAFFLFLNCDSELYTSELDMVLDYYYGIFSNVFHEAKLEVPYSITELKTEFGEATLTSILHIMSGAGAWSTGSAHGKQRLSRAVSTAFDRGFLVYPRHPDTKVTNDSLLNK